MPNATIPERRAPAFANTLPESSLLSELDSVMPSAFDAELAAAGLPAERAARIAARRAFVEMKHIFMRAVATMKDRKGEWLRSQVRLANEPLDLWLLRGPVLAALRQTDSETRGLRAELYRGLDSLFPHAHGHGTSAAAALGGPVTLPPLNLPEPWAIQAMDAMRSLAEHQNAARR